MKINLKSPVFFVLIIILSLTILTIFLIYLINLNNKNPIKIGVILSLTGAGSPLVDLRDSMILATDEVNSRGGINKRKIKLIFEDHETNPETGKEIFNKMEETEKPILYVGTSSAVTMALAPLAEEKKSCTYGFNYIKSRSHKKQEMGVPLLFLC